MAPLPLGRESLAVADAVAVDFEELGVFEGVVVKVKATGAAEVYFDCDGTTSICYDDASTLSAWSRHASGCLIAVCPVKCAAFSMLS